MSSAPAAESNPESTPAAVEPSVWLHRAVAATTFLGAFLLFQVQPLIGDAVLPWFGGTPAVWTTTMLFFQTMLVAGYAFVFLATRYLSPRLRSALYLVSAVGCAVMLPILPGAQWKPAPDADPTTGVLLLLFACVGAPYFLLSTTGPATQEWVARAFGNRSPYRLYALSNLGSLLGLLTYPFLVQPLLDLPAQSLAWSIGFGGYAVLVGFCAWSVRRYADVPYVAPAEKPIRGKGRAVPVEVKPATTRSRLREACFWIGLSAGGSVILLVIMGHLCQDIFAFPLLRVAPLVVYLATFIICFDRSEWYSRRVFALATIILVPLACWPTLEDATVEFFRPRFLRVAVVNLGLLFSGCMLCHGELAARKPEPQRLTFYYLMIAIGGALGGLLVGIIAPLIYDRYWEWIMLSPALFLFAAILLADSWTKSGLLRANTVKLGFVMALLVGLWIIARNHAGNPKLEEIKSARNFFGVVQISGVYRPNSDFLKVAVMHSGSTQHGQQVFDDVDVPKNMSRTPTTYYGRDSGIGILLNSRDPKVPLRVGVVGLGVGTLAAYSKWGDSYTFYEINPIVEKFANEYFTFLKDCEGTETVVLGDARLNLENAPAQEFDVLVLDAFSSDAIPTHLLTLEAMEIYLRHLKPEGILAVHISNRYLNLAPVMAAAAKRLELHGALVYAKTNPLTFQMTSRWILLTRNTESPLWKAWPKKDVEDVAMFDWTKPWTDQHCNFWDVLE